MTHDTPVTNDSEDNHQTPATPEDVAGLYSWAKLHDSKYRDFSASREKIRAGARHRGNIETPRTAAEPDLPPPAVIAALPPAQPVLLASASPPPPPKTSPQPAPQPHSPRSEQRSLSPAAKRSRTSSERAAPSRWAALNNVFEDAHPAAPATLECAVPVLALVSLAGGVGKTSLVASLGRSQALHGDSVLLVDTAMHSLLPLYFGSHDLTPGNITTFPAGDPATSVRVMTMDPEWIEGRRVHELQVAEKVAEQATGVNRILVDVSTGSAAITRQIFRLSPTVLLTLTPDMASVVSLPAARAFFQQLADETGHPLELFYILNQFDASLRLHADVHDLLARQLGDRLLPFAIHRSHSVSEALAEGMTVVDYAPGSQIVADIDQLSDWIRELALPDRNEIHPIRRRGQSC